MTESKKINFTDASAGPTQHIYKDPTAQYQTEPDPINKFFSAYWRPVVVALIAVGAVIYAKNVFQQTNRIALETASETFVKIQDDIAELKSQTQKLELLKAEEVSSGAEGEKQKVKIAEAQKDLDAVQQKLSQQLLVLGDQKEPYRQLGKLYEAVAANVMSDTGRADAALASFDWMKAEGTAARLSAELAALALGRNKLKEPGSRSDGFAKLAALAESGTYTHVMSAIILSRVASSDTEKATAFRLLESIKNKQPSQATLLKEELSRY